ncbi:PAS domain S-box/diguanylate cyclase (GGDEF) domain-containing protein [Beggiatoa alba B18LD]|uniref:PAS domain S-box/diguanylate cyclase (GGDEF) domain-containing protein n=1 Tax=Beggiatoa alba B18LD TaxID=395493 RepID=I3CEU2_9GAMM|nr:PAS domain S-box protein [Beggiatoa alba]EIJ42135.1 PAS domain S-box/diguanylate cyclase (GGDEF) domain-containing protein [Beggiatoa alba B18LD]
MATHAPTAHDFFNHVAALLCIIDTTGTIIQANPAWETHLGKQAIVNTSLLTWLHPDEQANIQQLLDLASQQQQTCLNFIARWRIDKEHYCWLQWSLNTIAEHPYYYAVATDITAQKQVEQQLRDSEERFQLAMQGANHGMWDWNLLTNRVHISIRWKQMLGYEDNEIPDELDEISRFVHPDDFARMWNTLEAYLDKRITDYEGIYRLKHKDQSYRWILIRAAALWDAQEVPYRIVGIYVDISEHKRIEYALQESQALLTTIFDVSKISICVTDEQGCFVRVNPAYCQLYGYQADELLGHCVTDIIPDTKHATWRKRYQALLSQQRETEGEWHIQNRQGKKLDILFTSSCLPQTNGQLLVLTTLIDITERKQVEEERSRLFNFSVDMQSISNFQGRFIELNPAWERVLGWTKTELLAQPILHFVHPDDHHITRQVMRKMMEGNIIFDFENRWLCKDGHYRWVSWTAYPRVEQQSVYAITRDITARKQAEQALRQSEERLRAVINVAPIILTVIDKSGTIQFSQGKSLSLLGHKSDALVGQSIYNVLYRFPQELNCIQLALNTGNTLSNLTKLSDIVLENKYIPLIDDTKQITGLVSVSIDITERYRLESELRDTVSELEIILENSIIGIAYVKQGQFIRVNRKLASLLGYSTDELYQMTFEQLCARPDNYSYISQQASAHFARGENFTTEYLMHTKKQKPFWARLVGTTVDANSLEKGDIWMIEDISAQKQAEQDLQLTATVFETTADGIFITDLNHQLLRANPAFSRITGYPVAEVLGKHTHFLASGRHDKAFYQKIWQSIEQTGHWQGEIWNRKKNGELYVAWLSISLITDEQKKPLQYMAILSDISRLQEDIEHTRYLANYDSLTGLPNRLLFHDNLIQARAWANRHQRLFTLLFIDIDGFKPVNDNLGHAVGDLLLQQIAERLKASVRETDTVARLGGDEFTVILTELQHPKDAGLMATRIINTLQEPFTLNAETVHISASIGISTYPDDGQDLEQLVKFADLAMYDAKKAGRGCYRFYNQPLNPSSE